MGLDGKWGLPSIPGLSHEAGFPSFYWLVTTLHCRLSRGDAETFPGRELTIWRASFTISTPFSRQGACLTPSPPSGAGLIQLRFINQAHTQQAHPGGGGGRKQGQGVRESGTLWGDLMGALVCLTPRAPVCVERLPATLSRILGVLSCPCSGKSPSSGDARPHDPLPQPLPGQLPPPRPSRQEAGSKWDPGSFMGPEAHTAWGSLYREENAKLQRQDEV